MKTSNLVIAGLVVGVPLLFVLVIVLLGIEDHGFDATLQQASDAFDERRFADAERLANEALALDPAADPSFPLAIAAQAAAELQQPDRSWDYIRRYPPTLDIHPDALERLAKLGDRLREQGRLSAAERTLRFVLEKFSGRFETQRRLGHLLVLSGRRWEAQRPFGDSVAGIPANVFDLLVMASDQVSAQDRQSVLSAGRENAPDDPAVQLAWGVFELSREQPDKAREHFARAVELAPDNREAQVRLGTLLLDADPDGEFLRWYRRLPPAADEHPQLWIVRGLWARDHGQPRAAMRCFWQSLVLDPTNLLANTQLAQLLAANGRPEQAQPFLRQAELLQQIEELVGKINRRRLAFAESYAGEVNVTVPLWKKDNELIRELTYKLRDAGRMWEAGTWARLGGDLDVHATWPGDAINAVKAEIDYRQPIPAARNPALKVNLTEFPLPKFPEPTAANGAAGDASAALPESALRNNATTDIRFIDEAAAAGIDFTYFNSADPKTEGMRMFEWTGGGVAVLDYDLDGWTDLYFAQGCQWPASEDRCEHLDRLFRNLGDGRFADVTAAAGLGDARFSQGCTVGDFDSDGFPDLYVANIGENRLYRNNGDGTFSDATEAAGIRGSRWTVSCLMADLDGDTHPEIYDVTYITGEGVFTTMCQHKGVSRACTPTQFQAEHDRLWFNRGDGRFEDISVSAGIEAKDGVGLGIVAADFENRGRLNLFVANDAFANFYFTNLSDPATGPDDAAGAVRLRFAERGLVSGLAFNRDGRAQACMGVACGDADADGRLDLFVTNFFEDYNTLYLQPQAGLFIDATATTGLRQTSWSLLGFGTQFLDGDLDGRPDLVLTNGDIDDFSSTTPNRPYRQPPQFLKNVGGGRFVELPAESLGEFFQKRQLGRGLARLDWNRDGRDDFAVSHLDTPAALVTNRSPTAGHFLALRLHGVASNRDAIGATVTVVCGDESWTQQLTAGDGYMASNERQLIFGLGEQQKVDRLTVRWPSGRQTILENLSADQNFVLVESEDRVFPMP